MIQFTPDAAAEIAEARAWYERHRSGLGQDLMDTVQSTLSSIQRFPESFPRVGGETRRARLPRFPYVLFYRIDPEAIVVVGFIHRARNPRIWRDRLQ